MKDKAKTKSPKLPVKGKPDMMAIFRAFNEQPVVKRLMKNLSSM